MSSTRPGPAFCAPAPPWPAPSSAGLPFDSSTSPSPCSRSCRPRLWASSMEPGFTWASVACPPSVVASSTIGAVARALATLGPVAFGSGGAASSAASSSTMKIVAPTFTFSPDLTRSSLMTPLTDEGTSMVALSVSSSSTAWSRCTVSPAWTSTRTMSPDSMFSPSSGSVNSVIVFLVSPGRSISAVPDYGVPNAWLGFGFQVPNPERGTEPATRNQEQTWNPEPGTASYCGPLSNRRIALLRVHLEILHRLRHRLRLDLSLAGEGGQGGDGDEAGV